MTRDQILVAIDQFKRNPTPANRIENKSRHWVFMHDGEPYPPKAILNLASGLPLRDFHTEMANDVLKELNFEVLLKSEYLERTPSS